MKKEELENEVIMSLTQYHDYKDFCERCYDNHIKPFMTEEEYIKWFNEFWACPEYFETAYDACVIHQHQIFLEATTCPTCEYFVWYEGCYTCLNETCCYALKEDWDKAPFYVEIKGAIEL